MAGLRILMLEDDANDARLIQHELRRADLDFDARLVDTGAAFQRELSEQPDLILADHSLPSFDGLSALTLAKQICPEVPFIFVSGAIGEEWAIQALRDGATDYVLKDRLGRLVPAVERALREHEERTRRSEAERLLDATNTLLALLPRRLSRIDYLASVVDLLREWSSCDCVGIRVLNRAQEIPYEAYIGFGREFWESENWLSLQHDQCACTRILKGTPEPQDLGAVTPAGSFYSEDLPTFLGGLSQTEKTRFRGRCAAEGFSTLAIVPIRHGGQVYGAIHMADAALGKLPRPVLKLIEELTPLIGEALHRLTVEDECRRNLEIQTVVNQLLQMAHQEISLADLLQRSLDLILSVSWLAAEGRGAILLADAECKALSLVTQRGMNPEEAQACAEIAVPRCLCGMAAATQQVQFAAKLDERHTIRYPGIAEHGHWCAPLVSGAKTLGVLAVRVPIGHHRDQGEEDFLVAVANALAGAVRNAQLFEQLELSRCQLQDLSHRLVAAQEEERRAVARELHDEAGQGLTAVMIGLGLLEREGECTEAARARIEELKGTTSSVMEGLHRLAVNLRPASLDRLGLVPALRQYLTGVGGQGGVTVELEANGLDAGQRLPPEVETTLYRIVQEAVTNTVRHAKASRVSILLARRGDHVTAIIADDGVGFEVDEAMQRGRLGLVGMRERATMFGGRLEIESEQGAGTTVYATLPSDPRAHAAGHAAIGS